MASASSVNNNLFYKLYSSNNNVVVDSGYTCSSAVNEEQTSFDISGDAGVITDSNGDTLASIDLSQIHSEGLTQYTTETRVLQPWSCCMLQGQEYGLACASYYFPIPDHIKECEDYLVYTTCDFDVCYNNFTPYHFHIYAQADGMTSFVDAINDEFDK